MRINNNIMAMNAHRQLAVNQTNSSKSMERLSSGMRINRAGDDAAGLAISEKMRGQIRGLKQAQRNAQDGISLIQTAEGALNEIHSILQRMRELATQAANDTLTLDDRKEIQKEINQLLEEIDRIGDNTEFNTKKLIDGSMAGVAGQGSEGVTASGSADDVFGGHALTATANAVGTELNGFAIDFSVSTNDEDDFEVTVNAEDGTISVVWGTDNAPGSMDELNTAINAALEAEGLGSLTLASEGTFDAGDLDGVELTLAGGEAAVEASGGTVSALKVSDSDIDSVSTDAEAAALANAGVLTQSGADAAITNINTAITQVSAERSKLGAYQNRLEHTISNLGTSAENLQAAESRIRDLDMAEEIMAFTKNNILQQAATAMLAQANMAPQSVLQLLG